MLDHIRPTADEKDHPQEFLERAERLLHAEQEIHRAVAMRIVSTAVQASDKPEIFDAGSPPEVLRRVLGGIADYAARRALLEARGLLREQRRYATGADPVGDEAARAIDELTLERFAVLETGGR